MARPHILVSLCNLLLLSFSIANADNCKVTKYEDVATAAKQCDTLTIGDLEIPASTTLKIDLKDGAHLVFDGHLTHVPKEWDGDLVQVTGKSVQISGTNNHLLDGLGPKHWKGGNEGTILRPKLIRFYLSENSQVKDLRLKNCACNCFMLTNSDQVVVSNINIDNKDGYPENAGTKYAKNTDGFDVSGSTNIRIENSVVYNQDDCVAINKGSNMVFENLFCSGSHGLSFSVWHTDVHDIEFKNCHVENANNVIHIKTHPDGAGGTIRNIRYSNITFSGITDYAVSIQENYPSGEAKANVPITNLTLDVVKGTMTGKKAVGISIICADKGCSDWHWSDVKASGAAKPNVCQYAPNDIQSKYC